MDGKRYALVTGGSRGIGRAISIALARELGYSVVINYHSNSEAAAETRSLIVENGGEAELLPFDVGNRAEVHAQLAQWQAEHPNDRIGVIVNNAGVTRDGLVMWMESDDWDTVLQPSLNGFYKVTKPLIEDLLRQRDGRIINVASVSGVKGTPGQ